MASLKIRYKDQKCRIECTGAHFPAFLLEFENTLKSGFFTRKKNAELSFFFPFALGKEECLSLFRLCEQYNVYIMEINPISNNKEIEYLHHCFHNGETYYLHKECIYVGDIEKDVHLVSNHDIYVIGCMKGVLDLLYKDNTLIAASLKDARIRIFDSSFHNLTNCAPCKVYYEHEKIKVA